MATSAAGSRANTPCHASALHLSRIERHVRANLADTGLTPEQIASACRISVRYLHDLFRDTEQTFSHWLRDLRLEGTRQALGCQQGQTLAQLAYQWGFTDQSHFSRVFKLRYGCTPKEERERQQNRHEHGTRQQQ